MISCSGQWTAGYGQPQRQRDLHDERGPRADADRQVCGANRQYIRAIAAARHQDLHKPDRDLRQHEAERPAARSPDRTIRPRAPGLERQCGHEQRRQRRENAMDRRG